MLPISVPKTHPSISPETCRRFGTGLENGQGAVRAAGTFEKNQFEYILTNFKNVAASVFGDSQFEFKEVNYEIEKKAKEDFAMDGLEMLLKLAFSQDKNEFDHFENEEVKFCFIKRDGEINYVERRADGYEQIYCSISVVDLLQLLISGRSGEIDGPKGQTIDHLEYLIQINGLHTLFLEKIELGPSIHLSDILSNCKKQDWKRQSELEMNKVPRIYHPIYVSYDTTDISESHRKFLAIGTLPETDAEKSALFVELCQFDDENISNQCRFDVLKNIKQLELNFDKVNFSSPDGKLAFSRICGFVQIHYAGRQISFSGLGKGDNGRFTQESITALIDLVQFNPNLTSISFAHSFSRGTIDSSRLYQLIKGFRKIKTLTELNFDSCPVSYLFDRGLGGTICLPMSEMAISLKNCQVTLNNAITLIAEHDLKALNLESNVFIWMEDTQKLICDALEGNTTITSFKMDWATPEIEKRCNKILMRNLYNRDRIAYDNFWELKGNQPEGTLPDDVWNYLARCLYLVCENDHT